MTVKEWAYLALGVWSVLFVTGVGIRAVDAMLKWWKKED